MRARALLVLLGVGVLGAPIALAGLSSHGALTQLPGQEGCVHKDDPECTPGRAVTYTLSVTTSHDGRNVYVGSDLGLAVFARTQTGALRQLGGKDGCVKWRRGACRGARAFGRTNGIAVSPDGANVYVTSSIDAVVAFRRGGTGALRQLPGQAGCTREQGDGECADGKALEDPTAIAVSPDGLSVYVVSYFSDAVAVFARDPATGALTQLAGTDGCVSEDGSGGSCADGRALFHPTAVTVSPDGENVYVSAPYSDAVAVFSRNETTGALTQLAGTDGCISETGSGGQCADGKALDHANAVSASSDGANVYVSAGSSDAVAIFDRDPTTGALAQLPGLDGCVSESGSGGQCVDGKALEAPIGLGLNLADENLYVGAAYGNAVAVFARDPGTGALSQLPGADGCVRNEDQTGECGPARFLQQPSDLAVAPDGANVYVTAIASRSVAVFRRN